MNMSRIMYRQTAWETITISRDGKPVRNMVSQVYQVLASQELDAAWVEAAVLADLTAEFADAGPEFLDKMAKEHTAKIIGWADTVTDSHPGVRVPQALGYLRPIDVLVYIYHAVDPAVVRNMLGQVVSDVRERLEAAHKQDYETRIAALMETKTYEAMKKEIMAYDGMILLAQEKRAQVEAALLKWASDTIGSPLVRLHGLDLVIQTIEQAKRITDTGAHGANPKPQYQPRYPTHFSLTRADCGTAKITGFVTQTNGLVRCKVMQGEMMFTEDATPGVKAPASNAAKKALQALVKARGGNPLDVAYNFPRVVFHWTRVDGPEVVEGTKEEADD
jgi:hypothetical protein